MMRFPRFLAAGAVLGLSALLASAQTNVVRDTFTGGSTVNSYPAAPTPPVPTALAYQQLSHRGYFPNPPVVTTGNLRFGVVATTSAITQVQALFNTFPVTLPATGNSLELTVTFVSDGGVLTGQPNSSLYLGFYNSRQVQPRPGGMNGNIVDAVAGHAQEWQGFATRIFSAGGSHGFISRTAQQATTANNQDLFLNNVTSVGSSQSSALGVPETGEPYTAVFRITRATGTSFTLASALYAGTSATGTPLMSHSVNTSNLVATSFDALALGYRATSNAVSALNVKSVRVTTTGLTTIVPEILAQPVSQTKSVGDTVEFAVTADGGNGTALAYQWRRGDEDLAGANGATLTLPDATLADAGDYTVVVTTAAGSTVSDVAVLTMTEGAVPPSLAVQPVGATLTVGGAHTFSVIANGTSPLTYQWERSTDGGGSFAPVADATSASLALSGVTLGQAGLYRVVVTNALGSATSSAVALVVNQAPAFTLQPAGGTLAPGGSITLTVAAAAHPAPTFRWRRNGAPIAGATGSSYTITNATGADTGGYSVVATNAVGSTVSDVATVAVLSPTMALTAVSPNASGRNPDTRLTITFNETPVPGVSGAIRIHDAADGSVVDVIDLVGATALRDTLRAASVLSTQPLPVQKKPIGGIATDFNYYPITVSGQTATIHPRNNVLAHGRTYYVTVEPGAFVNAAGESFAGISSPNAWRFSTKPAGPAPGATTLVVAADGSGDFDTVQAAFDFVPAGNTTSTLIRVRRGTYFEQVAFQAKHQITLLGEDPDETEIVYPNNNTFNNVSGVYHRATFLAQNVRDFTFANLTVRNTTPQGGSQAEALIINGTAAHSARNLVTNARFYSYQDTVQFNKQTYVSDTVIHGDVDFLWGDGPTFLVNCDIRFLRTAGYLTQIRNGSGNHGYVFVNTRFTAPAGLTGNFLGRIDPAQFPFSEVVILDSVFGDAPNNAFLATVTGASGSNYLAGWWRLDGTNGTAGAGSVRNWTANLTDGSGAPLSNPNADAFTQMPADETVQANYRNPVWVLNTNMAGTVLGSWTPQLAPLIAAAPVSQTVPSGAPVMLRVSAVGVPAVAYQWRKDGVDLPGATSATLSLGDADAGDAGNYSVVVTNAVGSVETDLATITVGDAVVAPVITLPPATQLVTEGEGFTLTFTAGGTAPFTYQWRKDGVDLPGATADTFSVGSAALADSGAYTVVVTNAAGSAESVPAVITVKGIGAIRPTGFAGPVTGGVTGATVVVTTAAQLRSFAEAAAPYTIVVVGTIDLGAGQRIKPRSNRTIRGATVASTILGTIEISNASNIIISNLNISADTGAPGANDGIVIANSTNILVTKCTIYDCTDGNLDIINGSDLVTISWCKFTYTRNNGHNFSNLVGSSDNDTGGGDGRTNYRVTWHHNWWTGLAKQRMIACRFGQAHMFNNLWDCADNDYCTETRNIAAIFSERNYYQNVRHPLAKRTSLPNDVGLLFTIGNIFDACTGTQLVANDEMFTPAYSYRMFAAADVPALVRAGAGNVIADAPEEFAATITAPAGPAYAGQAVTLTAVPVGFTPVSHQWRFKNTALPGATGATHALTGLDPAQAGAYSVVLGLADGSSVVSAPHTLAVLPAPAGADAWRLQYFGTTNAAGDAAPGADPDGDGLSNLLEYALGLDPLDASPAALPAAARSETHWVYTYTRPADRSDLSYAVEVSTTLNGWTTDGVTHERIVTGETETWEARVPVGTGASVFFRLRVAPQ